MNNLTEEQPKINNSIVSHRVSILKSLNQNKESSYLTENEQKIIQFFENNGGLEIFKKIINNEETNLDDLSFLIMKLHISELEERKQLLKNYISTHQDTRNLFSILIDNPFFTNEELSDLIPTLFTNLDLDLKNENNENILEFILNRNQNNEPIVFLLEYNIPLIDNLLHSSNYNINQPDSITEEFKKDTIQLFDSIKEYIKDINVPNVYKEKIIFIIDNENTPYIQRLETLKDFFLKIESKLDFCYNIDLSELILKTNFNKINNLVEIIDLITEKNLKLNINEFSSLISQINLNSLNDEQLSNLYLMSLQEQTLNSFILTKKLSKTLDIEESTTNNPIISMIAKTSFSLLEEINSRIPNFDNKKIIQHISNDKNFFEKITFLDNTKTTKSQLLYLLKQINLNGETELTFSLKNNLTLTTEQIDYLINNTNLQNIGSYGETPLNIVLKYNQQKNITNEQIDYLIKNGNLKQSNSNGETPLILALKYNQKNNLNLTNEQFDYLIKNSDLTKTDNYGETPLKLVLRYNKKNNLNLTNDQLDYLIKNSDLNQQNKNKNLPLILALKYNKEQNLNLTNEQIDYLIKNTNLYLTNRHNETPLLIGLYQTLNGDINLTNEQLDYLIKNSDLTKQNTDNFSLLSMIVSSNSKLKLTNEQVDYVINNSNLTKNPYLIYDALEANYNEKNYSVAITETQYNNLITILLDSIKKQSNNKDENSKSISYKLNNFFEYLSKIDLNVSNENISILFSHIKQEDIYFHFRKTLISTYNNKLAFIFLDKFINNTKINFSHILNISSFERYQVNFENSLTFKNTIKDKLFSSSMDFSLYEELNRQLDIKIQFKDFPLKDISEKRNIKFLKEKLLSDSLIDLSHFSNEQKNSLFDNQFIIELCESKPNNIEHLSYQQKNNIDIAFSILQKKPENFQYIGNELKQALGIQMKSPEEALVILKEYSEISFFDIFKKKKRSQIENTVNTFISNKIDIEEYTHLISSVFPGFENIQKFIKNKKQLEINKTLLDTKKLFDKIQQLNNGEISIEQHSTLKLNGSKLLQNPTIEQLSSFNATLSKIIKKTKFDILNQLDGNIAIIKSKYEIINTNYSSDKSFSPINTIEQDLLNTEELFSMHQNLPKEHLNLLSKLSILNKDNNNMCWLTNYEIIEWKNLIKIYNESIDLHRKINSIESNEKISIVINEISELADIQIKKIEERLGSPTTWGIDYQKKLSLIQIQQNRRIIDSQKTTKKYEKQKRYNEEYEYEDEVNKNTSKTLRTKKLKI